MSLGSGEESGEAQQLATATPETASLEQEIWDDSPDEFPRETAPTMTRHLPAVAFGLVVLWTAFFGWAHSQDMATGAPPAQWAEWIGSWAIPVLLVVAVWLLVMRNSQREAGRFNDVAHMLSTALPKASMSLIRWSAGNTSSCASPP